MPQQEKSQGRCKKQTGSSGIFPSEGVVEKAMEMCDRRVFRDEVLGWREGVGLVRLVRTDVSGDRYHRRVRVGRFIRHDGDSSSRAVLDVDGRIPWTWGFYRRYETKLCDTVRCDMIDEVVSRDGFLWDVFLGRVENNRYAGMLP